MKIDPITLGIVWERMIATCNEQVAALLRTSFSPVVREGGDLATGLFSPSGVMLAQPLTGTPGHINPLSVGVRNMLAEIPLAELRPGDVLITNDPWLTTGQLLDTTVLVPIFRGSVPVALFAATCHMVDIGGYGPGSGGSDVYEEGVQIPIMHFRREGVPDRTLLKLLRQNTRDPDHMLGDLEAMIASSNVGGKKLLGLLDEYGLDGIEEIGAEIVARSRAAQIAALRRIPEGVYRNEMLIDGFEEPIKLACSVTVRDGRAAIDFTGTSPESNRGVNVVLNYAAGYAIFGVRSATAPEVPNNDGSMGVITVDGPAGCILNAQRPAPTTARHIVGMFISELILGALRKVIPGNVVAEGAGSVSVIEVRGRRGEKPYTLFLGATGGMGARPVKDGLSTVSFPSSVANIPLEIWESVIPVVVKRRELRRDSGGPGKYRGGLGQLVEFALPTEKRWLANMMTDRNRFAAAGTDGGMNGALGRVSLAGGDDLPGKGRIALGPDDVIVLETAGGGGWGSPFERDPEAVRLDVQARRVTETAARDAYGVVLDAGGNVDEDATRRLRAERVGEKELA